jgi:Methylamine utilisation protein MauE
MSAPVWSQADSGVALALGAIVATAAVRKLQRPDVFGRTLQKLDSALAGRPAVARRLAFAVAAYEVVVGVGVIALRGNVGFVAACALLVACAGFLVALARAVQRSVPCACFGRLGRTAAGGREIGRGIALVVGAGFLVVHRALAADAGYGVGPLAVVAVVLTVCMIVLAQRVGGRVRPGVEVQSDRAAARESFGSTLRNIAGYDNDLYSSSS